MKLTAENVHATLMACLHADIAEPDLEEMTIVNGITQAFGFKPECIEEQRDNITSLLSQLPDEFHVGKGGGFSFLHACNDKDGNQWGEHRQMEALFCLGLATEQVTECLPREMWVALPGGVPYYQVNVQGTDND